MVDKAKWFQFHSTKLLKPSTKVSFKLFYFEAKMEIDESLILRMALEQIKIINQPCPNGYVMRCIRGWLCLTYVSMGINLGLCKNYLFCQPVSSYQSVWLAMTGEFWQHNNTSHSRFYAAVFINGFTAYLRVTS